MTEEDKNKEWQEFVNWQTEQLRKMEENKAFIEYGSSQPIRVMVSPEEKDGQ